MDRLFITKCKSDFERVINYIKNNGGEIIQAIGDDWHCAFMIRYKYYKYVKIDLYGKIQEVE